MRTLLLWAAALLFGAASALAQVSVPLRSLQEPSRKASVAALNRGGALYLSVNDLAAELRLPGSEAPDAARYEIRTSAFAVRFFADNPFVVVVDPQQNASIVQFPLNVVVQGGAYYAPADQLVPLLHSVLNEELTYDRASKALVLGRPAASRGPDIAGVSFEQKANGYLIRLHCNRKLPDYDSFLKTIGEDTWLYLTVANARADARAINAMKPSGAVKKVVVIQSPASVQLTFRLKGAVSSTELIPAENSNDILVAVRTPSAEQVASRKERPFEQNLDRERNRWKLDVVVIDAGHGGTDPGTIGVTGTKEKDVTLAVAMKLGRIIQKELPDVKVVYTRTTDTFVELYRRGQIANQAGGKLFVSIHCNSTRRKPSPVDGFEIYLLRPGKTDAALRIAEQENAVVKLEEGYEQRYEQLTEENFILLTMAQSAYVKYSEKFASILVDEMGKHLTLDNNGVKQAGFYVLVGASMPNVLVETGYLSNRKDEAALKSAKGQQRMAEAIFNGVKRYKREYERSLEEGSDLGSGQ